MQFQPEPLYSYYQIIYKLKNYVMENFIEELKRNDQLKLLKDIRFYLTAVKDNCCLAEEQYTDKIVELIDKKN